MRYKSDQIRREYLILENLDNGGGLNLAPASFHKFAVSQDQGLPGITFLIAFIALIVLVALPDHTEADDKD
jgi:hypothetical protein